MRNGDDVIVVGAGVVGSSTACHLAKAGVNVTLVEPHDLFGLLLRADPSKKAVA